MAYCNLGSYYGAIQADTDMVTQFKVDAASRHLPFTAIRKLAIEAPADTRVEISGIECVIPTTGILEFGLDYIPIDSIVFKDSVDANIIYLF